MPPQPSGPAPLGPVFLGIDTGGTYTDAVLWTPAGGARGTLLAKAKALTTRHDLSVGIAGAVDAVLSGAGIAPGVIALASMSTTLATNALVEGQGNRAALVMIGFDDGDMARDGLAAALGSDPVLRLEGGHDVHGRARPLDLAPLEAALPELAASVTAVAVCAYFAVRNPEHELAAAELIRSRTGLPVTMSHELSSKLGGPRRALTTLLNARLVGLIERLVAATEEFLAARGSTAPLMVVRGDGALVSAGFARRRPIETILSGPAASLVGARHLTGLDDAFVSDIGGTTTDVALLAGGRPRLDPDGATVGGHRTMVEAVAMRTFGLGGDSEVALADGGLESKLVLGPHRIVPLSLAAHLHGEAVRAALERQLGSASPGRLDGRFAFRTGLPERFAAGLSDAEAKLFATVTETPQPLDRLVRSTGQQAVLGRLVARGLVAVAGFTPSDAAHVLGRQANWDAGAARLGAALFSRRRDGRGLAVAETPEALCERVLAALARRSAEAVFETAFAEDGLPGAEMVAHALSRRALDGAAGTVRLSLVLDRPVVGLGASAPLHYARLGDFTHAPAVIPADADVANALGAVVGQVRLSVEALVSRPSEATFRVSAGAYMADFRDEEPALAAARAEASRLARERAVEAGADEPQIDLCEEIVAATVDGQRIFVEARIVATAFGRPRIAMSQPR